MLTKLKQLYLQPKASVKVNGHKLSVSVIAIIVVAEIMLLLVAPLSYYSVFAPKTEISARSRARELNLRMETYPLTERQIEEAWPNLPTVQQLVKSGVYGGFDTDGFIIGENSTANKIYFQSSPDWWDNASTTIVIQNETQTNVPSSTGLLPVVYIIYLQLNGTMWIQVPQTDLDKTNHPPIITPSQTSNGFLGTSMPATYGYAATATTLATVATSVCYLIYCQRKIVERTDNSN